LREHTKGKALLVETTVAIWNLPNGWNFHVLKASNITLQAHDLDWFESLSFEPRRNFGTLGMTFCYVAFVA